MIGFGLRLHHSLDSTSLALSRNQPEQSNPQINRPPLLCSPRPYENTSVHSETENVKMRDERARWVDTKTFLRNSPFGKTVAYKLLGMGLLRAKKLGSRTVSDERSRDEYLETLPDFDQVA